MVNTAYARLLPPRYSDGTRLPRRSVDGSPLPLARVLSYTFLKDRDVPDTQNTLATMQWGQLVAHDTAISPGFSKSKTKSVNYTQN